MKGETPLVTLVELQRERDVSVSGGIFLDCLSWCVVYVRRYEARRSVRVPQILCIGHVMSVW